MMRINCFPERCMNQKAKIKPGTIEINVPLKTQKDQCQKYTQRYAVEFKKRLKKLLVVKNTKN